MNDLGVFGFVDDAVEEGATHALHMAYVMDVNSNIVLTAVENTPPCP